jgi:outer membrane immunogenic protein
MNRWWLIGFAVAGLGVSAVSAQAADAPARPRQAAYTKAPALPPFDWNGFYLGANGGYSWARSSWSDPAVGADSGSFDTKGGLLGGQIGYNWQSGHVVLGVESDIDWANIKGSTAGVGGVCATDGGGQCRTEQTWLGTTRARIGYAFDRWLPYVTGGVAYGNVKAVQSNGTSSDTKAGWTAGGGVEYGINKNWSAKVEYQHLDLGTATFMGAASGTSTLKAPIADDLVRAGLNYHW